MKSEASKSKDKRDSKPVATKPKGKGKSKAIISESDSEEVEPDSDKGEAVKKADEGSMPKAKPATDVGQITKKMRPKPRPRRKAGEPDKLDKPDKPGDSEKNERDQLVQQIKDTSIGAAPSRKKVMSTAPSTQLEPKTIKSRPQTKGRKRPRSSTLEEQTGKPPDVDVMPSRSTSRPTDEMEMDVDDVEQTAAALPSASPNPSSSALSEAPYSEVSITPPVVTGTASSSHSIIENMDEMYLVDSSSVNPGDLFGGDLSSLSEPDELLAKIVDTPPTKKPRATSHNAEAGPSRMQEGAKTARRGLTVAALKHLKDSMGAKTASSHKPKKSKS